MARKDLSSLLNGKVQFLSGKTNYKPSIDAVLLASLIKYKQTNTVLDIGIGSGAVSLCLLYRYPNAKITGIDTSLDMLSDAKQNIILNNQNIELEQADIMHWKTSKTYDIVMTNPPFFVGTSSNNEKTAIAHTENNIDIWIRQSIKRIKPRGYFYCIIDTGHFSKLVEILSRNKMGEISIYPIYSFQNKPAERVLISARLGVNTESKIYSGIIIHNSDTSYSKEAERILRNGESFIKND